MNSKGKKDDEYLFLETEEGKNIKARILEIASKGAYLEEQLQNAADLIKLLNDMQAICQRGFSAYMISFEINEDLRPHHQPSSILEINPTEATPAGVEKNWEKYVKYMSKLLATHTKSGKRKKQKRRDLDLIEYRQLSFIAHNLLTSIFGQPTMIDNEMVFDNIIPPYVFHVFTQQDDWG